MGRKWVYTLKSDADAGSKKYMARSKASTLRKLSHLQLRVQEGLILHQMDVKSAYVHTQIDCEVYLEQPEGYETKSESGEKLVCKFLSLFGLKQSGRNSNTLLHAYLSEKGFNQNPANNCLYSREKQNEKVVLIVRVDDLIIAANTEEIVKTVKRMLTERFKMKDLGMLNTFLGIDFKQSDGQVTMTQVYREAVGSLIYLATCTRADF